MLSYSEYINTFEFDFSEATFENINLEVEISKHGEDRSHERYGKELNISYDEIKNTVNKAKDQIEHYMNDYKTFVIHDVKSKLNVVGAFIKKANKFIFKVITVMYKAHFEPKFSDKFIPVYETTECIIYINT